MSIDVTFRTALGPGAWSIAPVFGLSVRTRLLGLSYDHPDDNIDDPEVSAVNGIHFGAGVAPVLGLQWVTKFRDGTRLVMFAETYPEVTLWLLRHTTDNTHGRLPTAPAVQALVRTRGQRIRRSTCRP